LSRSASPEWLESWKDLHAPHAHPQCKPRYWTLIIPNEYFSKMAYN
jgi:hypothetical protein